MVYGQKNTIVKIIFYMTTIERAATVLCGAILGHSDEPLFIECMVPEVRQIDMECLLCMSLDAIDDALVAKAAAGESYLGLVYVIENMNVYALTTPARSKIMLVVRWFGVQPLEKQVRAALQMFYDAYVRLYSNPFYSVSSRVQGPFRSPLSSVLKDIAAMSL